MQVLLVAVVVVVKPCLLKARCPSSLDVVWNITAKEKPADPVFSGTVAAVTNVHGGQVAIFEVDRVWRGRVPNRVTV
jgi:cell division septation protein DedD